MKRGAWNYREVWSDIGWPGKRFPIYLVVCSSLEKCVLLIRNQLPDEIRSENIEHLLIVWQQFWKGNRLKALGKKYWYRKRLLGQSWAEINITQSFEFLTKTLFEKRTVFYLNIRLENFECYGLSTITKKKKWLWITCRNFVIIIDDFSYWSH